MGYAAYRAYTAGMSPAASPQQILSAKVNSFSTFPTLNMTPDTSLSSIYSPSFLLLLLLLFTLTPTQRIKLTTSTARLHTLHHPTSPQPNLDAAILQTETTHRSHRRHRRPDRHNRLPDLRVERGRRGSRMVHGALSRLAELRDVSQWRDWVFERLGFLG